MTNLDLFQPDQSRERRPAHIHPISSPPLRLQRKGPQMRDSLSREKGYYTAVFGGIRKGVDHGNLLRDINPFWTLYPVAPSYGRKDPERLFVSSR